MAGPGKRLAFPALDLPIGASPSLRSDGTSAESENPHETHR